jgi:hypothetical protein
MKEPFEGDLHAGISGLELQEDRFDLGEGVSLSKTYAHLTAPFIMAFAPAPPGGHHPAPWKAASGGFGCEVTSQLHIPGSIEEKYGPKYRIATNIVFLLRLWINPATTMPVISNYAFTDLPQIADKLTNIFPTTEALSRYFPLVSDENNVATVESVERVKSRWQITCKLINESAELSLAVEAISAGQFIRSSALILVSLWGAMEALFSPSTSELKFRISALIAAFLEPPGNGRAALQREIAKLYDKRSAAAHGKPRHEEEDVLSSFNLLARILTAIIDNQKVPSKEDLEGMLFGEPSKSEI